MDTPSPALTTAIQQEMAYLQLYERSTPTLREWLGEIRGKHYLAMHMTPEGKLHHGNNVHLNKLLVACGVPTVPQHGWPAFGTTSCTAADTSLRTVGLVPCRTTAEYLQNPLKVTMLWLIADDLKGNAFHEVRRYCIVNGVSHWEWQGDGSGDSSNGTHWHNTPTMTTGSFDELRAMVEELEDSCWHYAEVSVNNEGGYWILQWDPGEEVLTLNGTAYVTETLAAGSASWDDSDDEAT